LFGTKNDASFVRQMLFFEGYGNEKYVKRKGHNLAVIAKRLQNSEIQIVSQNNLFFCQFLPVSRKGYD